MTARYLSIAVFCVTLTHLGALDARSANVLLVTNNNGSLTAQESLRRSQFQTWGHTVNTIWDGASQAAFNTAFAANDVVYVSEEVNPADVAYKVRSAPIGVVSEERFLDAEFGFSTSDGSTISERRINITNNSHEITSSFSTGLLMIVTGWQDLVYLSGSAAPGGQTLATIGGASALFVIDAGGALANTYGGNSTAAGRRVRLPFGDTNFDFSRMRNEGLTLLRNAIDWATNVQATGLIGHWALNETSGTTATDASDNSNDGTYTGGVTLNSSGPYPGAGSIAARFNGVNGHVSIPDESDYDITDHISIAVWIKVDVFDATWQAIICKGDSAWRLSRYGDGDTLHFALTGVTPLSCDGSVNVNDGEWHHVVGTYDGSTMRLYVDGALDHAVSASGSIATNNFDVLIGANGQASGREWCGSLFDVRVYDYALSEIEIAQLYGLVGHWKLDETSGTTADDSSLAGNDGVYTNNPTLGLEHVPFDDGVSLAVGFDGVDDYVEIPYNASLDSQSYTVSAWVYCTAISDEFESGILGTRNGVEYGFDVKVDPGVVHGDIPAVGDSWLDTAVDISSDDTGSNGQGGQLALNQWYLVTYVVDGTSNTANLYLDGDLKRTISLSGTPRFIRPGQTLMLGNSAIAYDEYFHGRIDDVRLYNRPLSPAEIQEIYSTGSGVTAGVRIIKWVEIQ